MRYDAGDMPDILDQQPEAIVDRILTFTSEYEFRSFVLGIQRPGNYVREVHESAYRELKIVLGTRLSELWPDRVVEFENPVQGKTAKNGVYIAKVERSP